MSFCGFSCAFLPLSTSHPRTLEHKRVGRRGFGSTTALYVTVFKPQHVRGKLLTPSYSHGPLVPCFPAQQSPSHQKLRVLALGRWLLAGPSRELRHPRNVPGAGGARRGRAFLVLLTALNSHWGGRGSVGPGAALSYSFVPLLLHSLFLKSPFSVR